MGNLARPRPWPGRRHPLARASGAPKGDKFSPHGGALGGKARLPGTSVPAHEAAAVRAFPAAKRLYDIVFSLAGLVALSPAFLLIGALIKIADGGDIFYRQIRIGLQGRPFRICKFRTMVPAAEQVGPFVTKDG